MINNPEEIENLETDKNTRPSTWKQIPINAAKGVFWYNARKALPNVNLLTIKLSVSQVLKLYQNIVEVLAILIESFDTIDSDKLILFNEAMKQHDWQNWNNTMALKYFFLIENETKSFVDRLHNQKVISTQ